MRSALWIFSGRKLKTTIILAIVTIVTLFGDYLIKRASLAGTSPISPIFFAGMFFLWFDGDWLALSDGQS